MYAIETDGLSKRYRLGVSGTGWLVRDVSDWLGESLRRVRKKTGGGPREDGYVWALSDVSFNVAPGEVLGIVGRNGAGKSTLLKLLSRITRPTRGEAVVRGRVASLLEVGTGFHPELTGRENVFINGAIQGMTQAEIRQRFDEIIAFAGVDDFVDTPVKRYSSGMYLRLAFSVAAHLRAEILLVDEVLAVGDVEFQRKCLEKMEDVGHEGRTVLFVSHNMGSLLSLCGTGLLLEAGRMTAEGTIEDVVRRYLAVQRSDVPGFARRADFDPAEQVIESVELLDAGMNRNADFNYGDTMNVVLHMAGTAREPYGVELRIRSSKHELVAYANSWIHSESGVFERPAKVLITIPELKLVQDDYLLDFNLRIPRLYHVDAWWEAIAFKLVHCQPPGSPMSLARSESWGGVVLDDVRIVTLDA